MSGYHTFSCLYGKGSGSAFQDKISGDKHLLVKSGYGGVQVMKPPNFV